MKVYIVTGSDVDDFSWIEGVYADLALAQARRDMFNNLYMNQFYAVEAWEVK